MGVFKIDEILGDRSRPREPFLGGYKTERDFTRAICKEILAMARDFTGDRVELFGGRFKSLIEGAHMFLLMYGTGEPDKLSGILTERHIIAAKPRGQVPVTGLAPREIKIAEGDIEQILNLKIDGEPFKIENGDVVLLNGEPVKIVIEHEPPADYGDDGLAGCHICKELTCRYELNRRGSMPGDVSK